MEEFYSQLAEILEVEEVTDGDILNEFATWDSLAFLSVISMVQEIYQVLLTDNDLKSAETVEELTNMIIAKKG